MYRAALKRAGAELAHVDEIAQTPEQREAARLAEHAAAFCLFGLRIALDEAPLRPSAHAPYQAARETEPPPPANDAAPGFAFPDLPQRGLHLPPGVPMRLIQAMDWLVVAAAAEFAARWGAGAGLLSLSLGQAFAFLLAALCLKAGLWLTEAYRVSPARMRADRDFGGLALGAIAALGVATFIAPNAQSAGALAACVPLAAIVLAGAHAAFAVWIRAAHRAGVFSETVVLIGATKAAERLAARAAKTGEARIVAIVDDRLARSPRAMGAAPVGGNIEELLAWEGLPNVDRIVITVTQKAETRMRDIIARVRAAPNRVDLLLDYRTHSIRGRDTERFGGAAVACVSGRPRNFIAVAAKRAQDIVLASTLLVVSALPMLAIAAAIRLETKGPALYRQRRHGFNNRPIEVLKFRTMRHAPDAPVTPVAARDPRITRVGARLRRYSLDELPQLINVLKGDMSLVGPRPHAIGMKAADRDLSDIVAEYAHRHCVKPGITGWAQVNGVRGSVTSATALRKRVRLDLDYVSRASLWRDLQILARTPGAMLRGPKYKH